MNPAPSLWDTEVGHGYTMADLHKIARIAASTASAQAMDYADRVDTAFSAVAEALLTAEEPPGERELICVGRAAVNDLLTQELRHHGTAPDSDTPGRTRPAFERYWWWAARRTPSHEDRIVEEIALRQIWQQLRPGDRRALVALAVWEDYAAAARARGVVYQTLHSQIRHGRRTFLRLWHEGETPSALWGRDRRRWRQDVDPSQVKDRRTALARRRRAARRSA